MYATGGVDPLALIRLVLIAMAAVLALPLISVVGIVAALIPCGVLVHFALAIGR